jgi:uncharacterized protein YggE
MLNINTKYVNWAVGLLCIFLAVLSLTGLKRLGYIGKEIYPQRTIMASGEGEAYAIPDIASFSFGSTESGDTVKEAQKKVDAKINKALSAIKDAGVEEKDIKTVGYNVYPKYEWEQIYCITTPCPGGKNVLKGYEVSQTISVKVRDTSKAGDLITKIGTVGVTNISGLEFTVDDREKYVSMAREQAIAKAKANAKQMAKDLGVRLGKLMYFNENGNYPMYYGMDAKAGMGGEMMQTSVAPAVRAEVPTGETKITSSVSITYEIK